MASAAILGGADKRKNAALSTVPAILPCMPTLPNRPAMAATSSMALPVLLATGAAYFRVSPNICRVVLEVVKVAASTSPTLPISWASNEKPLNMFEAMSAVCARSTPAA